MIGIFGGTFDPVHFGHLRAASEAKEHLSLAHLRLLPAGNPPHRSFTFANSEHRLAMLKLALQHHPDLASDDREVRRGGDSYMVDTLKEIRSEEGNVPLLLMIGQDAANALDAWFEWESLFDLAHIVIMRRPQSRHVYSGELFKQVQPRMITDKALLQQSPSGYILPLEVTQLAISSTEIRRQIASHKSSRFLLPDEVIEYIHHHRLYSDVIDHQA
jgi:nicotinate-nucleotide adenylyltransferase